MLAACSQPGKVSVPIEGEPPAESPVDPTDPEDPEPTEPGLSEVTLRFPDDLSGLPVDTAGNGAVTRLAVHWWPAADEAEPEPAPLSIPAGAMSLDLTPGEAVTVPLAHGDYTFESAGYGADPAVPLAWSRVTVIVGPDSTSFDLGLRPVLGGAELLAHDLLHLVAPGDQLRFELLLRGAAPGISVPAGYTGVIYDIDPEGGYLLRAGADGLLIQVAHSASGNFGIRAVIDGPGIDDGVLIPNVRLEVTRQVTVDSGEPDITDWQAPELRFDPIDSTTGELTGFVADGSGTPTVRVFRGALQVGSSAAVEQSTAVAAVSIAANGNWSMPWVAPAGTAHLRAVATDLNGRTSAAFRSVNVVPPADPDDLSGYTTLSSAAGSEAGPSGFDELAGFCPANEFRTPGQGLQAVGAGLQAVGAGLQAVGAVGGVFLAPTAAFGERVIHAHHAINDLEVPVTPQQGAPSEPVVLLVVDDYGPPDNTHYHWPTLQANHESLSEVTRAGLLTHGAMVAQHSYEMLTQLGYSRRVLNVVSDVPGLDPYETLYRTESPDQVTGIVILQYVNTYGLDTEGIATAIRANLTRHSTGSGEQSGTARFVVNMSFVILPCAVTEDLAASGINSFEDYVAAVAAVNGVSGDEAGSAVTDVSAEDALAAYFDCPFPEGQSCAGDSHPLEALVHVASSGNFGMDFPLYPAAYDNVIAVGSLDVLATDPRTYSPAPSAFSNRANVLAPGALFMLTEQDDRTIAYAGTSFAAPIVSVFLTHDLGEMDLCSTVEQGVPRDGLAQPAFAGHSDMPLYTWSEDHWPSAIMLCPPGGP